MSDTIGISENRLKHSLAVARTCYLLAKRKGFDEAYCNRMFLMGYLHDVGYEFATKRSEHPMKGTQMLLDMGLPSDSEIAYAIKYHGKKPPRETTAWEILNIADLTTNSRGEIVNPYDRLKEISDHYGDSSRQYRTACDLCYRFGLIQKDFEH